MEFGPNFFFSANDGYTFFFSNTHQTVSSVLEESTKVVQIQLSKQYQKEKKKNEAKNF
jgi:hypothetical protein